jgi:hypothetical protein
MFHLSVGTLEFCFPGLGVTVAIGHVTVPAAPAQFRRATSSVKLTENAMSEKCV